MKDKYLYCATGLKKLVNMSVTMMPIVEGAFEIVPKDLEKKLWKMEIRGIMETI